MNILRCTLYGYVCILAPASHTWICDLKTTLPAFSSDKEETGHVWSFFITHEVILQWNVSAMKLGCCSTFPRVGLHGQCCVWHPFFHLSSWHDYFGKSHFICYDLIMVACKFSSRFLDFGQIKLIERWAAELVQGKMPSLLILSMCVCIRGEVQSYKYKYIFFPYGKVHWTASFLCALWSPLRKK